MKVSSQEVHTIQLTSMGFLAGFVNRSMLTIVYLLNGFIYQRNQKFHFSGKILCIETYDDQRLFVRTAPELYLNVIISVVFLLNLY